MITSRTSAFGRDSGRAAAQSILRLSRRVRLVLPTCGLAVTFASLTAGALADGAGTSFPRVETLLGAQHDDANWILPAKTYAGNRYTALAPICRVSRHPH